MTKRLQPCRTCKPVENPGKFTLPRGFTRHENRICSQCRHNGPPVEPVNYLGRGA